MIALAQSSGSFWMPPQGSTVSGDVDSVFYIIYWISVFFFALIVGLMAWFVIRYRSRRPGDEAADPRRTTTSALEITWTAIPVIVSAAIFVLGFKSFMNIVTPPAGAYEIQVTGQKWQWFFTYPDGYVSNELHVPVARPVKLVMTSEDVIHSLFIPAFRVKKDVVPGRYSKVWFEATTAGHLPLALHRVLRHRPLGHAHDRDGARTRHVRQVAAGEQQPASPPCRRPRPARCWSASAVACSATASTAPPWSARR